MADARVSVVMITHNRRAEADLSLSRLEALPEQPPIVVVDNGSTDGTADMVRSRHPAVALIAASTNLGAVGRNIGVSLARTPYVAFCDDDTWYDPGALTHAADLLDAHPELVVVTASILVEPGSRLDPICAEMARSPLVGAEGMPGHPLLSFLAGVSVLRKDAFEAAGGFSAHLWLGGEEELLASDLARQGWRLAYVPEVVAHHQASSARDAHLRRRHGIRNTLWFTWSRRPLVSALRRTGRLVVRLPRDRVTLLALRDALLGAPWVWRNRAVVPPEVEQGYRRLEDMQLDGDARSYVS
jgi:N-acetylglucosaminyl-diphospho-decaprenol L-rhamnosyltransferase